jgi:hypothetical protein
MPPSTNDPSTEIIHDSGSHKDGEIRSEIGFGGEEDLFNDDIDLNELVIMKAASHPPSFVFGESKVTTDLVKEYKNARFSLSVPDVPLQANKFLLLKPMKLLCFGTSLHANSNSPVIPLCLPYSRGFQ